MLKERPLVEYYDEVAVPGLRLLQNDLNEGLLEPDTLSKATLTIDEIVDVAGEYEEGGEHTRDEDSGDAEAVGAASGRDIRADWRGQAPVLCIAARSPFDHSVAIMLKQLLTREGIGMRIADVGMTAPSQLSKLDTDGVALICLSYLAVDHSPSQARFIVRRLRRRIPGIKILIGFWASQVADAQAGPVLQADSGADSVATTLSEAISICLREATIRPPLESPVPLQERTAG